MTCTRYVERPGKVAVSVSANRSHDLRGCSLLHKENDFEVRIDGPQRPHYGDLRGSAHFEIEQHDGVASASQLLSCVIPLLGKMCQPFWVVFESLDDFGNRQGISDDEHASH